MAHESKLVYDSFDIRSSEVLKEMTEKMGHHPYDMSVKAEYPYSYYSIDEDQFFPKYKSGTPMNRGELLFLETIGRYTIQDDEYVIVDENSGARLVMEEEYAISSGIKEILEKLKDQPYEKQNQVFVHGESPEDISFDACIQRYEAYLDAKLGQKYFNL